VDEHPYTRIPPAIANSPSGRGLLVGRAVRTSMYSLVGPEARLRSASRISGENTLQFVATSCRAQAAAGRGCGLRGVERRQAPPRLLRLHRGRLLQVPDISTGTRSCGSKSLRAKSRSSLGLSASRSIRAAVIAMAGASRSMRTSRRQAKPTARRRRKNCCRNRGSSTPSSTGCSWICSTPTSLATAAVARASSAAAPKRSYDHKQRGNAVPTEFSGGRVRKIYKFIDAQLRCLEPGTRNLIADLRVNFRSS
jgi:hypothetical protein